jgi:hypothetical protein
MRKVASMLNGRRRSASRTKSTPIDGSSLRRARARVAVREMWLAVAQHPVAPHHLPRPLDVHSRVGLDQIAAGGPAEQALDVRQHPVGHDRHAAVHDRLDQGDQVALADLGERAGAQDREHLAAHDPLDAVPAAVAGLVALEPVLDHRGEARRAENPLGLGARLVRGPGAERADGDPAGRRRPAAAGAVLRHERLAASRGDQKVEAGERPVEVEGPARRPVRPRQSAGRVDVPLGQVGRGHRRLAPEVRAAVARDNHQVSTKTETTGNPGKPEARMGPRKPEFSASPDTRDNARLQSLGNL